MAGNRASLSFVRAWKGLAILLVSGMTLCCLSERVTAEEAPPRMLPRPLHAETVLVADGKPEAAIVAPSSGPLADAAKRCQAIVGEVTGVKLPMRSPDDVTDERKLLLNDEAKRMSLVFLGNVGVNRALLEPYLRRWFPADEAVPGPGRFLVETRPNPWGTGCGYVFVGASDAEGLDPALDAFEQLVAERGHTGALRLGRVVLPGPDPLKKAAERWRRLARPKSEDWLEGFKQAGKMHLGYNVGRELHDLTLITELGYLSPEEINDIENEILENVLMIPEKVWWYREGGRSVGGRHEMFKNPRLYLACEHLLRVGRPDVAAKARLEKLMGGPRQYVHYAVTHAYRSDHEGTEADHAWQSALWFALLTGDWEYFDSGLAREAALYGLLETDNLGGLAGHVAYGGVANLGAASTVRNAFRAAAWWYHDGRFRWLLDNLPLRDDYPYGFPLRFPIDDVELEEPKPWLGVAWLPLSEHSYATSHGSSQWAHVDAAREDTVDLLTFREGYGRDDQYLCLDGFQNHFHPPGLNCVLRYVDRGKLFLVAHTDKSGNYYKSGVVVSQGLRTQPEPWGVMLTAAANLPQVGMTATLFPSYNGCDWTRHIFWRRGQYFVFLDDIVARSPGRFNLTATWRAAAPAQSEAEAAGRSQADVSFFIEPTAPAELTDSGWQQRQGDVTFLLKSAFPLDQRATRGKPEEYQNEVIPDLLRQTLPLEASDAGHRTAFQNLLYATGPGDEQSFSARRLTATSCLVRGTRKLSGRTTEELAVMGLGGPITPLPLETDAAMFYVSPDRLAMAEGSVLKVKDRVLASAPKKQDLEADVPEAERSLVANTLEELWHEAQPSPQSKQSPPPPTRLRAAWTFSGFRGHARRVEPVAAQASAEAAQWTYRFAQPVDFDRVLIGQLPKAPIPSAVVEFSNDGFVDDVRSVGELKRSSRIHGPYGKSFFATQQLLSAAGQRARWVRVRVAEWTKKSSGSGPPELGFVEFYSTEKRPAEITRLIAAPLGPPDQTAAEASPALVAQTRDNQVLVLDSSGRKRWSRDFEHNLTSLAVLDMDGDATPELVGCDAASDLYVLGCDGRLLKRHRLSTAESIYQDYFRSNRAYSLGLWRPAGQPAPSLMMGTYQSVAWVKPDGTIVCWPEHSDELPYRSGYVWRGLVYWDKMLGHGLDFNGDGVEDQAFLGRGWATEPSVLFFDGARLDALAEYPIPNGWPLGMEITPLDGARSAILAANEFHLGLYAAEGARELWHVRFDTPAADYTPWNTRNARYIAVAKRDGMVLLLDEAGQVVKRKVLRPEFRAIAPLGASRTSYLIVAGDAGCTLLDDELEPVGLWPHPAHLLEPLNDHTTAAATGDGRIVALSLAIR